MRALTSGDLHGTRDNTNKWRITEAEADRWIGQRPDRDRSETGQGPDHDRAETDQRPDNDIKLLADMSSLLRKAEAAAASHEARADALATQVDDLRAERDRLLSIIERQQSEARPIGFFSRLFGR